MTSEKTTQTVTEKSVDYRVPEHVYVQDVLDEMVIMDTHAGEYFELNAAGADIFRHLRNHGNVERLISELETNYQPAPATLREDVLSLISELANRGLILSANH